MVVAVFGDIDPDRAAALVGKALRRAPARGSPPIDFHRPNALRQSGVFHKRTSKDIGVIMLGYPCESIFQRQDHAAMTVLKTILSGYGYPGGWLHNELRGRGLVYFVQAFEMTGPGARLFHQ